MTIHILGEILYSFYPMYIPQPSHCRPLLNAVREPTKNDFQRWIVLNWQETNRQQMHTMLRNIISSMHNIFHALHLLLTVSNSKIAKFPLQKFILWVFFFGAREVKCSPAHGKRSHMSKMSDKKHHASVDLARHDIHANKMHLASPSHLPLGKIFRVYPFINMC